MLNTAQLFLTALGIAAAQGLHHHGGLLLRDDLVHGVDAVLLVVLHADDDLVHAEHLGQELGAADDLLGTLQHGAVVAGDVGLALRAVDDDGVHLADAAGDLHVGGERGAAHADDAGVLDDLHHLLHAEGIGIRGGLDLLAHLVLHVIFNDHRRDVAAHGIGAGLHCLHRAGNAGVDRGTQSVEFADLLAHLHVVPGLDQGRAGRTKVHRHGDDHLSRRSQLLDGLFIGCGLHVMGMNAAKESLCHCLHLIFTPWIADPAGRHSPSRLERGGPPAGGTITYCAPFYTHF